MEAKRCTECGRMKLLTLDFYTAGNRDGRLNQCKECVKARVKKRRQEDLDRIQEYDRCRGQDPRRKAANRRQYKRRVSTPEGREREWARQRGWMEKNQHKRNVHIVVGNAVRRGVIIPPAQCVKCGAEKPQAHHEDYSKPFDITWLCTSCHGARHRELNEKRRND